MFEFKKLEKVKDAAIIFPKVHGDERGFFLESYKKSEFAENGINYNFLQDNHSRSSKNILRGLHFQAMPKPQGKLVRVLKGRIFDVIVDLRSSSSSYKKWQSVELSGSEARILWVPPGFAHGFLALEDNTEVFYKTTAEYDSKLDSGIIWNDPELEINWPIKYPILSAKDSALPSLASLEPRNIWSE